MSSPALLQEASFDQKANSAGIRNRGFRPELYTVDDGIYASNGVYGVGVASTNSYANVQLARGTSTIPDGSGGLVKSTEGCDIRQHGSKVEFSCSIVLDGNPATAPTFGNEELRIRPINLLGAPPRYKVPFPLPNRMLGEPTFEDVEIVNKLGVQIAPDAGAGTGTWLLGARLLKDGTLALTKKDNSIVGTQETALRHSDIDAGFSTDEIISINVRGHYRAEVPSQGGLSR